MPRTVDLAEQRASHWRGGIVALSLLMTMAAGTSLPTGTAFAKNFSHAGVSQEAARYESSIKASIKPGNTSASQNRREGDRLLSAGNDPRGAYRFYLAAISADPASSTSWLGAARALLAIPENNLQPVERYRVPANASAAAYMAYERASAQNVKAQALVVLSNALKRRSMWRPAIDALASSLDLVNDATVRQSFEELKATHGFRITDYKVDNEAARPRLCVEFSERLAGGGVDFNKFISIAGQDPESVTADGSQLCVDGLEHGKRYDVQVRAGLPSIVGEDLPKAAELAVYVRDRSPAVRVTGKAYVLPSRGQNGIPIITINTDKVAVEIFRIGDRGLAPEFSRGEGLRALSSWSVAQIREKSGELVYTGTLDVTSQLNQEVTTAVPVGDAIGQLKPGVYALIAKPEKGSSGDEYSSELATQWFIISDLGMTAFSAENGLHAFVRSLATTAAKGNAAVKLVARNNEVLAIGKTDERGYVRFDVGLKRGEGGMAPALLVAEINGDYAFLDLASNAFDLTDRGVKGREAPAAIDGFVYTDRGVYRPEESVHLTALVRDNIARASDVPTTLIVSRPDGVEHRRYLLSTSDLGGRATTLALTSSAMTGTWRARLYTDPKANPIAQTAFLVEDFVAEKLALELKSTTPALEPGREGTIDVAGRFLYGPPAAGLAIEGEITVRTTTREPEGFRGYNFGLADEVIAPVRSTIDQAGQTDAQGKARLIVALPQVPRTARTLDADVSVRLREPGGRTIERRVTVPVDLGLSRIGIKPLFKASGLSEDAPAAFEVLVAGPDGKPLATKGLAWELVRLETSWQWAKRDGVWSHDAVTLTRKVASGTIEATGDQPARISTPVRWGRYRLDVVDPKGEVLAAGYRFSTGWYVTEENADSPETLEVALDRASYTAGDTAKVRIATRKGGRALVAVFAGGLVSAQEVTVPDGGTEISLPVGRDWGSGAYVTATLYRPLDETARRMPSRALGLAWLGLDQAGRTLHVDLKTPANVRPGETLNIPVAIKGLTTGEAARVTVAAVDIGILNLTRFEAPSPEKWFYQQHRLGTEIRDLYGRLIDGMRAERGRLRSGGDGDGGMAMHGSPPVESTLALFSGIVKVGDDGTASVAFDMPNFNGTVRLMAVAWSADKLGHASREVVVRDKVALTVGAPRFMTLGDEAQFDISVHNVEGPAGLYSVALTGAKNAALELAAGTRKSETFTVKPTEIGLTRYLVKVAGPDGITVQRELTFDVKAPGGDVRRTTVHRLEPGTRLTIGRALISDMIPERTRVTLSAGPNALIDMPRLLTELDRYPYGCAEQTVSRALPLVYLNDLSRRIGIANDSEIKDRVQKAVERVFSMQDSTGAFGAWGPTGGDLWLTAYVTDFLTRTREAGYAVKPEGFTMALDRLANFIATAQDFESGGEDRAYALYVLARNGRAPIGDLRYYADARLDRFATPLAKAQLGAALAMLGDRERSERVLRSALTPASEDGGFMRRDYGSDLRDRAGLITLASETRSLSAELPGLTAVMADAFSSRRHTSTQEQAWLLLAARALSEEARDQKLEVNGRPNNGQLSQAIAASTLTAGDVVIANRGTSAVSAVISVIGAATTPEPAAANGFTIERKYFTLEGKPVDFATTNGNDSRLAQTSRLVTVLTVTAQQPGGRVLLVDRLPAGLEIENPRLVDGTNVKALSWLKRELEPKHTEFRDDRFVASYELFPNATQTGEQAQPVPQSFSIAYIVRAVTPGTFVHPAATVEDMYRPERMARTTTGRLVVTAKN